MPKHYSTAYPQAFLWEKILQGLQLHSTSSDHFVNCFHFSFELFPQVVAHLAMTETSGHLHYEAGAQDYLLEIPFCDLNSITIRRRLLHFEFVPVLRATARLISILFMRSWYHCSSK